MTTERRADAAYHQIERMIVLQEVAPGTLVSEAEMMDRTGIGRTPVREALQRLARSRMVEIYPNKGVLIPPISVDAELKSLEIRRVLEVLAVKLACERASEEERKAMYAMAEAVERNRYTLPEYMDTVKGTHDLIIAGAHNAYLVDAMTPLQGLSRRFWLAHVTDADAEIKKGSAHHVAILRAILNRDAAAAQRASEALNDYLIEFSFAALRGGRVK
jgi:DNA-binding GntR family transcriptional regulator